MDTIERETYFVNSNGQNVIHATIPIPREKNYTHICVTQATIPKSFYLLQEDATLTIQEPLGATFNMTFPKGNYSSLDTKDELNTQLNANLNYTYTITGPFEKSFGSDGKFTIIVTNNNGDQPLIKSSHADLTRIMGFADTGVYESFVNDQWRSTYQVNFQKYSSVAIISNIVERNLLQIINTENSPYNSAMVYQSQDLFLNSKKLITHESNVYSFQLVNGTDFSEAINLQGQSYTFEIMLWRMKNPSQILSSYIYYRYRQDKRKATQDLTQSYNSQLRLNGLVPQKRQRLQNE